jgi:uncharacterized protein (UPF0261 family)
LHDPQTDKAFVRSFKKCLTSNKVEVVELKNTIDDPEFADAIVEKFLAETGKTY